MKSLSILPLSINLLLSAIVAGTCVGALEIDLPALDPSGNSSPPPPSITTLVATNQKQSEPSEPPKQKPLSLVLDLIDGSRIIGVPSASSVKIVTSFSKTDIPLKNISTIQIAEDRGMASINFVNGDLLKGTLDIKTIELETIFGKHSIGLEHVARISRYVSKLKISVHGRIDWSTGVVKKGVKWRNKKYIFKQVPAEISGAQFIIRSNAHGWLPNNTVSINEKCTLYVALMWEYMGKIQIPNKQFDQMKKDGWKILEQPFSTTSSPGEVWRWKVIKKDIQDGTLKIPGELYRSIAADAVFMLKQTNEPSE